MADSVAEVFGAGMERLKAQLKVEIKSELIAELRQEDEDLHPWISTARVLKHVERHNAHTFTRTYANNPEVIERHLVRKFGNGYEWKNPEFLKWLHNEDWDNSFGGKQ